MDAASAGDIDPICPPWHLKTGMKARLLVLLTLCAVWGSYSYHLRRHKAYKVRMGALGGSNIVGDDGEDAQGRPDPIAHRMAKYKEEKEKDEMYADEMGEYYPNEPTWASMFPRRKNYATELFRDRPDFTKLKPNDPMFLDMQWPQKTRKLARNATAQSSLAMLTRGTFW